MTEKDLYLFLIQITNNKITTPQTFYDKNTCSVIKKLLEYNYIDNYLISTKRMDGSVSVAVPFSITIEGNKFIKKFESSTKEDAKQNISFNFGDVLGTAIIGTQKNATINLHSSIEDLEKLSSSLS